MVIPTRVPWGGIKECRLRSDGKLRNFQNYNRASSLDGPEEGFCPQIGLKGFTAEAVTAYGSQTTLFVLHGRADRSSGRSAGESIFEFGQHYAIDDNYYPDRSAESWASH